MLKKFVGVVSACCLFFSSLAGCTININIGNADENTVNETNGKEETTMYESRATIYIFNTHEDQTGTISSSDLAVSLRLIESKVQDKIREEYADVEYTLSLEQINETEISLIATSETPEYLEEICNIAVSLFCETLQKIYGASCKIVDYAKSAQEVGTN